MEYKKILLLEKSNMIRLILKRAIVNEGITDIREASDLDEAFNIIRSEQPNIICMSYVYYEIDNKNIFYDLNLLNPNAKIILISSTPKEQIDSQIFSNYKVDFVKKDSEIDGIINMIKNY